MLLTEKEQEEIKNALLAIVKAGGQSQSTDGDKEAAVRAAELLIKPVC